MVTRLSAGWVETILDIWFRELDPKAWFTKSDATDALIRERGLAIHEQLARELPPETREDARAALARSSPSISSRATCFAARRAPLPPIRWRSM